LRPTLARRKQGVSVALQRHTELSPELLQGHSTERVHEDLVILTIGLPRSSASSTLLLDRVEHLGFEVYADVRDSVAFDVVRDTANRCFTGLRLRCLRRLIRALSVRLLLYRLLRWRQKIA